MSAPEISLPETIIDCSHLGRKTTGIERITEELFSDEALGGCQVVRLKASSIGGMLFQQWFGILYAAIKYPKSLIITPGFPPSILATLLLKKRLVPYIHDVFLLTREQELNPRARYYMRPSFAFAVKRLNSFFVNSVKTKQDLQQFCYQDQHHHDYRRLWLDAEQRLVGAVCLGDTSLSGFYAELINQGTVIHCSTELLFGPTVFGPAVFGPAQIAA